MAIMPAFAAISAPRVTGLSSHALDRSLVHQPLRQWHAGLARLAAGTVRFSQIAGAEAAHVASAEAEQGGRCQRRQHYRNQ